MRYGDHFKIFDFNEDSIKQIDTVIANSNLDIKKSSLYDKSGNDTTVRVSEQAWIKDVAFCKSFLQIGHTINGVCKWNFDIQSIESIQYGIYREGGRYDWHIDQNPEPLNGSVRKISMTLFMNDPDEYEGGEFDLEIYKPEFEPRYQTFKLKKGSAIFFQSDRWHRVRPVSSGVRKSLVAWFSGPTIK